MAFLVIAYPDIDDSDFEKIQEFRKRYDTLYFNVIDPHFTLVFATLHHPKENFVEETKKQSNGFSKIDFTLRNAIVHKDELSDYYNVFLVPSEGYSSIIKLHDTIYSGLFRNFLREDIEYIPHITIGNSKNKDECEKMVNEWNEQEISISGAISSVTVIEYSNKIVVNLQKIELG